MADANPAIVGIVNRWPSVNVVLSDAIQNDSYFHLEGPDGGTLYLNAETIAFVASLDTWKGRVVTSEGLPEL
ncbi:MULTISPECIES: hypothetical protein [unclassified Plantibacter]|uniref:hypothetical protein n=1 Tax=unclassified Plantibacter TaxID=2624265 RepID=UPI003D3264D5